MKSENMLRGILNGRFYSWKIIVSFVFIIMMSALQSMISD